MLGTDLISSRAAVNFHQPAMRSPAVDKVQYEEEAANDFEYHPERKPKMPKKIIEKLRSRLNCKERLDESKSQRNPIEPVGEPMEAFEELISVVEESAEAMKKAGVVIGNLIDTKTSASESSKRFLKIFRRQS